jgi:hypothetical protein
MHDVPDPRAERLGASLSRLKSRIQITGPSTAMERFLGNIANNRELPILFDLIMRVESIPLPIRMEGHPLIRSSDSSDQILHCISCNWLSNFFVKTLRIGFPFLWFQIFVN